MKTSKNRIIMGVTLVLLVLVSGSKANAQKGEIGLRFMPTITDFVMHTSSGHTVSGEAQLGYGFGVFGGFNFTDHVGIQAEVIYSSLSQKYKESDIEREINLR